MNEACENTDRELWREKPDDYYAPSIHVTRGGGIGINVGGSVIVMPLGAWHALARQPAATAQPGEGDALALLAELIGKLGPDGYVPTAGEPWTRRARALLERRGGKGLSGKGSG